LVSKWKWKSHLSNCEAESRGGEKEETRVRNAKGPTHWGNGVTGMFNREEIRCSIRRDGSGVGRPVGRGPIERNHWERSGKAGTDGWGNWTVSREVKMDNSKRCT